MNKIITLYLTILLVLSTNICPSQMSSSSTLTTSGSVSSVSSGMARKTAAEELKEMEELAARYEEIKKKQVDVEKKKEDEEEEKKVAEKEMEAFFEGIDAFIDGVDKSYPEDEAQIKELEDRANQFIMRIPEVHQVDRKETREYMAPSFNRLHSRFNAFNLLIGRWDAIIKRARANPEDPSLETDAQALKKVMVDAGYQDTAEDKYYEVFHPIMGPVRKGLLVSMIWLTELFRNSTDMQQAASF